MEKQMRRGGKFWDGLIAIAIVAIVFILIHTLAELILWCFSFM